MAEPSSESGFAMRRAAILLFCLAAAPPCPAAPDLPKLIEQLGSDDFDKRIASASYDGTARIWRAPR
jgi:hypothetical protein